MSRKIKFRAWVNGHWTDFIPVAKTLGEYNESLIDTGSYTYEKDNPFIVEQYTGLKDKNGKEIYEGDIVEIRNKNHKNEYNTGVVRFRKGAFGCPFLLGKYQSGQVEVIGNIHENPEFLGGGKWVS